ncbi:uncharacterized protein ACRADG_012536 [Cochliomyia hominivorax]
MSVRSGNISNSSLNRTAATTSTMHHHTRRSFQVNETIEEEVETPKVENVTTTKPLKRHTPILFSTNRGLHLRTTNTSNNNNNTARTTPHTNNSSASASSALQHSSLRNSNSSTLINSLYNITFCDLERWSTNRANTISLEDTFTIPKPAVVPSSAASGSLASTSLRFLPHKATTSVRFNGYSRFDVE